MAAWVEATTREMGQTLINPDKPSDSASALPGDTEKPAFGPKPHLMPKPFTLQRNATVRSIRAPKNNFNRQLLRATSSDTLLNTTDTRAGGLETSDSNGPVNGSDRSAASKPIPLSPKPDLQAKPKPELTKSPDITGPNSKPDVTAEDIKNVQYRSRAKSLGSQDRKNLNQKSQGEAGDTEADVKMPSRCWPAQNRLSMQLTSKFESPSQPEQEVNTVKSKTEKEGPPHSPSAVSESKPSKPPVEKEEEGDEEVSGGSIKRRISLLFDRTAASQRRDTFTKKDITPAEISINIKQRIQNLSLPSTGAPKSPPFEKTNERSSERPADSATEKNKPPNTTEIKNSGVENAEEKEDDEVEEDKENYVKVPVYQRVGISVDVEKKRKEEEEKQRKDEQLEKERQQQEKERLLEEERKAKEIQKQQEEDRKQEEEKQRQMEERKKQEEEWKKKLEEERKEEERRRQAEKERERQQEQERLERERQIQEEKRRIEEEKERQIEEERLRQEKLKKEKEMEEERRRIQELERQKEEERMRQEQEKEERLKKEREMEEERRRIQELERLKEEERLRQEREKEERLKKEREMEEERRRVQEMERQKEEERMRKEQEMERIRKEKEMEEERRRIQEMERQKEEERMRKEQEMERIRKEKEMEEERQRIQEMERQKKEENLRQEREKEERLKKEREMEEERLKEEERLRQEREKEEQLKKEREMEEERRRIQELERQKEEERMRKEREMERIRKEKEMEEERLKEEKRLRQEREKEERLKKEREMEEERLKEEERLRQEREKEERLKKEREMEEERRRIQEMERQKEEERLRKEQEMERIKKERETEDRKRINEERQREEEERLRQEGERLKKEMEMEACKSVERLREEVPTSYDLISFNAEEPAASPTLVSAVSPQLTEVLYDDFSVKPRRWGTGARRSSTPSPSREPLAAPDHNLQPESKSNDPGSQEPHGDQVNVDDLIGLEPEASSPQNSSYKHTESREQTSSSEEETESKPEDLLVPETQSDEGQLKDCEPEEDGVSEPDTENLIDETDEQTENIDTVDDAGSESRINLALQRLAQVRQRNKSTDSERPDTPAEEEPEPLPVLESAAPLLDSSVFRSKVDLAKKRSIKRSRPTRSIRQRDALPALTEGKNPDWRFCDSTDAKDQRSNGGDSESEEEPPRDVTSPPAPSQPKRIPMFPGMDPSALMAQLKRRSGVVEADSPPEAQTPPSVPTRSPRTPTMALGPRVLPPVDAKDSGSGSSPSWLLELKSKKRTSQPESEA